MSDHVECCPQLPVGKKCDYIDFVYRLTHYATVTNQQKQPVRVPVEVGVHVRLERCTHATELGNLVYSTTLMPGEKVRLFSSDRRSRFSYDSETQVTYRHERHAEEQYYMDSFEGFMSNLESREDVNSSSTSNSSSSGSGETSGLLGTIFSGPSVSVSGSYNASSTRDFMRELRVQAESSHNKSVNMTRESSAISFGEVQTRKHVEGESESSIESSSRLFENKNQCHAVSYLFYQVNKVQTVRFQAKAVRLRVVDPAGDSSVVNRNIVRDEKLRVLPAGILATEAVGKRSDLQFNDVSRLRVAPFSIRQQLKVNTIEPMPASIRDQATAVVMDDLKASKVLTESGNLTKEMQAQIEFEFSTTIPTPGVVVKGCLDDCNVCEDTRQVSIKLDLERKQLENERLKRQIELLDQSQEYRCCPVGEAEETEDA